MKRLGSGHTCPSFDKQCWACIFEHIILEASRTRSRNDMKRLGKIASAKFGAGGYQDAMFGLTVGLEFPGGDSCVDFKGHYRPDSPDSETIFVCRMLEVAAIMDAAKVDDIGRLRGIPIEAEFDGLELKSWRVLTEVL